MKKLRNTFIALLLGLCAPGLIWVGMGAALSQKRKLKNLAIPDSACSVDTDCPPGFICVNGHCVQGEGSALSCS